MSRLLENLPKVRIKPKFYKSFPETPGVYVYFKENTVIYIGKAINLKRRISSYFDLDLEPKTSKMISEATFISYIQVESELASLLLEAKLIRQYMPHYNIEAKDDKHPLYIRITKEEYPRVVTARKISEDEKNIAFYGPFPSSNNVKTVLRLIRRIIPFSDHKMGTRACLYSHIGLCNPCPSVIQMTNDKSQMLNLIKQYRQNIRKIKQILDGNIDKLTRDLTKEMATASKLQDYEYAAVCRNQISQLEYVTRPQMPTDFYMQNPNLYEDLRKKELDELKTILNSQFLNLKSLHRLECYDIAHLMGTNATASMVTFVNGEPDKSMYRHFKIKIARGGDDYGSMAEVAKRRAKHFTDWGKPDLIIVDGGKEQVRSFTTALRSDVVSDVIVVGIAKHPDRLIIVRDQIDKSDVVKKILLTGPALNLVSRLRDEAHRFARRLHHKHVSNTLLNQ